MSLSTFNKQSGRLERDSLRQTADRNIDQWCFLCQKSAPSFEKLIDAVENGTCLRRVLVRRIVHDGQLSWIATWAKGTAETAKEIM
jgi:hypothetical protein